MTVEWTMQPHSRLLTLPVELRLCIYEIVFLPIQFSGPRIPDASNEKASRALLPLLAWHQINEEARLIAFSRTTFHVPNIATSLKDRLQILSSQLLGAVRYLTIMLNLSLEPRAIDILDSSLPDMGLEQLTLIIRKPRPVESNRGPESDPSYLLRTYPYIITNSIRFEIHSRDLRPSKVKRFSILHDGCYRSTSLRSSPWPWKPSWRVLSITLTIGMFPYTQKGTVSS